ncbi:putative glycosyl transferase [Candidatus Termititenax persephonae]|uniref:Glycosyl transferase n=1 Tax=Candidatus Termititenax persephonae TaxID=2218525 RepID=A0A388TJT7_9BACT|nr:putative glycosyl transferase [Candidatus Termititenax persephonae]
MPARKNKRTKKTAKKPARKLPTISLCMIVRDAAANLDLCLSSVQKVVDEIVIVDTGSRDGTVEIARKYTDKIYHFKWCDDFAKARNASLKHATRDWILVLDDDEVLRPESAKIFKRFLAKQPRKQNVYTINIYECDKNAAENEIVRKKKYQGLLGVHKHGRLLRNHQGIKFVSPLHERIVDKHAVLYDSEISILHYGYSEKSLERLERNYKIMQKELAKKPDDALNQYNYTRAYASLPHDSKELLANMEKTIALYVQRKKNLPFMPLWYIYTDFINILITEKLYAPAEKYCYAWLSRLKDNYDLWPYFLLGKVLFLQEKMDDAYRMLQLVYTKFANGLDFGENIQKEKFMSELYYFYGACCLERQNYKLGLKLLRRVRRKYYADNPGVDKLIEIAEQRLGGQPQTGTKVELPTISLCMIVRDAAANLDLCLSSVQKVVDEIVIVDTGSRDGTIEIARKYTDKIYHFKWCDDFAAARNESLKYATKDWILVLSDDEALTADSAREIKKFLAEQPSKQNVYGILQYNCRREEIEASLAGNIKFHATVPYYKDRLLRNRLGLHFIYPVHETVANKNGEEELIYPSPLKLLHYGQHFMTERSRERDLRVLKEQLAQNPHNVIAKFYLTKMLSGDPQCTLDTLVKNMDETIDMYLRHGQDLRSVSLPLYYQVFIDILINKQAYQQAEKYCQDWIARIKGRYDLFPYLWLGKTLFLRQKTDDAYRILGLVYEKFQGNKNFGDPAHLDNFTADLYYFYGVCCLERRNYQLGLDLLRKVKEKYYTDSPAVDKLITLAEKYKCELDNVCLAE